MGDKPRRSPAECVLVTIVVQVSTLVVSSLIKAAGIQFRLAVFSICLYWMCVVSVAAARKRSGPRPLSAFDLFALRYGYVLLLVTLVVGLNPLVRRIQEWMGWIG